VADYNGILSRNLFNSEGRIPGEEGGVGGDSFDLNSPAIRTQLPLALIGTVILRDELRSLATIEDKSASQVYPVRVDDEIPGKLKILKVEARRVEFINSLSGRKEFVDLPEEANALNPRINVSSTVGSGPAKTGGGVEKISETQFNVSRTAIDSALANMADVLTQARAIPHTENGQMVGFKLFSIVPGSIYDQLGLKNGDLLCGVDGEAMNDPTKAMALAQDLKNKSRLELCIKRNGRTSNFAYEIR
jgi:general secretion pathway protein C